MCGEHTHTTRAAGEHSHKTPFARYVQHPYPVDLYPWTRAC